jgi:putative NIF3 family GTP cyclohydrolase 1 type 2
MRRDALVAALDAEFGVADVRGDDWSEAFELLYPDPYWREYAEPGYEGRWNGLMVAGGDDVERVATCVFPSDGIVRSLPPGAFLFSEHPIDHEDEAGFLPLARESFRAMRERALSFYHVHAPLDMHPRVSPSRLCAGALGLREFEEYYPIAKGIPGGAVVIGRSDDSLDGLARRLGAYLGPEIPVRVLSRPRAQAGRVAVAAGGGADRDMLRESLARGCQTFVTGNAATRCRLDFVQREVQAFLRLAEEAAVAVVDATHYGMEKPPQIEMVAWFRERGLAAEFLPEGPK